MRIALLIDQLTIGGTELQMMQLVAGLADAGHHVSVRSLRTADPCAARAKAAMTASGVDLHEPTAPFAERLPVAPVARWLQAEDPDVLIASMSRSELTAVAAMRLPRIGDFPVVGTRRSLVSGRPETGLKRAARAWAAKRLDGLIANSAAALADSERHEPVGGKLRTVIPNIVAPEWFRDIPPRASTDPTPKITTVANLRPPKGHLTLIEALGLLRSEGVSVTAQLAGAGPLEPTLRQRAHELGVDIVFLGTRSDVGAVLAETDLYVHPSDSEGMPNAVLEAMASGCAIVATDVGGTAEALGGAGLLVAPADPAALADGIHRLLSDPEERALLGKAAAVRAQDFTLARSVEAHEEFFGLLIAQGTGRQAQPVGPQPPSEIVIIGAGLGAGGAEKQSIALANHLVAHRSVRLLGVSTSSVRRSQLDPRIPYTTLGLAAGERNPLRILKALRVARKQLRGSRRPLMISFTYPAHTLGWGLQIAVPGAKHIVSERNAELGSSRRVRVRRFAYQYTSHVTTNTAATSRRLAAAGVVSPSGVSVIPNLVELDLSDAARSSRSRDPFRWICVASLTPQKDHLTLLRACAILRDSGETVTLALAGIGELRAELEAEVQALGLVRSVEFLGTRDDVPALMSDSDGLVLSSRWEGLPNVLLEAASLGLPIVATDVGGSADCLPSAAHTYLVPPQSPPLLAEQMWRIMTLTPADRDTLGRRLQAHVADRFSPATILDQWDRLIAAVESGITTREPA